VPKLETFEFEALQPLTGWDAGPDPRGESADPSLIDTDKERPKPGRVLKGHCPHAVKFIRQLADKLRFTVNALAAFSTQETREVAKMAAELPGRDRPDEHIATFRTLLAMGPPISEWRVSHVPMFLALGDWYRLGCPVIDLVPDFFQSVAVTDFGDASEEQGVYPFYNYMIRLPENQFIKSRVMFVYQAFRTWDKGMSPDGKHELVAGYRRRISLASPPGVPDASIFTEWNEDASFGRILQESVHKTDKEAPLHDPTTDHARLAMARRIMVNTTLYISSSGGLPPPGQKLLGPDVPVEREHRELPRFRVGRPIKLQPQLREALAGMGTGTGWKLGSRFIVRGHFRNQAVGKGRAERKRIWVAPFWKGPSNITEALQREFVVE
jgi:hypothetical protein